MPEFVMDFPDFVIRRLEAGPDTEIFREIRLESLKVAPESFGMDFGTESGKPLEWFAERLTSSDMFGAFHGEDLLGIAGFYVEPTARRAHKGVIWGVYVRPKARSAGVARSLIEAVLAEATGRVEQINLIVERGNLHARRLYTSLGFVEYGVEKNAIKIGDRYFDDVLMAKALV
jgi:GNAT superfamily N-acetyltransferase